MAAGALHIPSKFLMSNGNVSSLSFLDRISLFKAYTATKRSLDTRPTHLLADIGYSFLILPGAQAHSHPPT